MSTLADRLRSVVVPSAAVQPAGRSAMAGTVADIAETLDGEWRGAGSQRFLVVDRTYKPGHVHGRVAVCDAAPDVSGTWPRLHLLLAGTQAPALRGRLLFLDLETTGLAGGAGSYAFLVGCAWFDGGTFRVRQFFLSSFDAERLLLDAVTETVNGAAAVVTYNGKSFDLPLIDTRFLLRRMATPFAHLAHVDMVHPARRLWRSDDDESPGCRLSELEQTLCGHEREGDVPGFEIPARYFHYVRSGDARGLEAVFEHNRLDLISLALVTARAAQMLEEGAPAIRTAREGIGLGRLYERSGLSAEAHRAYARAIDLPADSVTHAEALRASAVLSRRERRYDEAASSWRRILELRRCPPLMQREAAQALAVHHEHRLLDLELAKCFAMQSLSLETTASRTQAVQYRLARLDCKLEAGRPEVAALF